MRTKLLNLALALLIALLGLATLTQRTYAMPQPTTPPKIDKVWGFSNLAETGDVGFLVEIFLDYSFPFTLTATDTYLVSFVAADGVTQLRTVAPFSWSYGLTPATTTTYAGYWHNLAWIYFSAADVAAYGLTSTNVLLYKVWLMGNPTADLPTGWAAPGTPPKTIAGITQWYTVSSGKSLLGTYIISYALQFQPYWITAVGPLAQATPDGYKLTTPGESYFTGVMPNAKTLAPSAFAGSNTPATGSNLNYSTTFGAVVYNATANVTANSPFSLGFGSNPVNVSVAGTFTVTLPDGASGTAESGTGTVTGSPFPLVAGANTVTVPGGGTGTIYIVPSDTGGTFANGTGTANAVSPITMSSGSNTIISTMGTFVLYLLKGTVGTVTNAGGVVTGSPVTVVAGVNTLTVTGAGAFTVAVALSNTQTVIDAATTGTGFDTSAAASIFGLSATMFSGLIWFALCLYGVITWRQRFGATGSMLIFDILLVGGALLGVIPITIPGILLIGMGLVIGYALFYRQASY